MMSRAILPALCLSALLAAPAHALDAEAERFVRLALELPEALDLTRLPAELVRAPLHGQAGNAGSSQGGGN